jgi:imidazolonepropionase-like amidohydrolase
VLRNATLFDSLHGRMQPNTQILIEGERVVAVTTEPVPCEGRRVIDLGDLGGATVLPGLIDAHVHVTAATIDLMAQALETPSLVVARTSAVMRDMLRRGFTSVRDAGGADYGLQESVAKGLFEGPRLFIAGYPISQTGGHADMRPRGVRHEGFFCTCAGLGLIGAIADGVGEARKRTREQVRTGANQIKIMAGGGVASPTDPIQGTQFSMDELRAICEEAEAANLYAMAHAYSPRAVTRAVQAGVRSIEHGNLIDEATAREMKRAGAYLVPTLSTYAAFADTGRQAGWSEDMQAKFDLVWTAGARSLEIAKAEGVPIVFGTDLLGGHHPRQLGEFALRAGVLSPVEQLQGATSTAARLMGQEGRIGVVAPGAFADLIVMEGDPTRDITLMGDLPARTKLLMQGGRAVVDTIGAAGHS